MSEKREFSKLDSMKKCPFCGGELDKGYIHSYIYWDTVRHKYLMGVPFAKEILISPYSWTVPYAPALKCNDCRIVIFDYGKGKKRNKQ
jgi:hypothetical protein